MLRSPFIDTVDCVSLLNLCDKSNFNFELSKKSGKIVAIPKRHKKIMAPILKPSDLKKLCKISVAFFLKLIMVCNEIFGI